MTQPFPIIQPNETLFLHKTPIHTKAITKIQYSNSGNYLASASLDMTISIIKTPTFEKYFDISSFTGHNSNVNSMQFSTNDEYLISASSDKTVVVWSVG